MQDQVNAPPAPKRVPWNKGKLTGAKRKRCFAATFRMMC